LLGSWLLVRFDIRPEQGSVIDFGSD